MQFNILIKDNLLSSLNWTSVNDETVEFSFKINVGTKV